MSNAKPRIAKDYEKLPQELINRIKLEYPYGFEDNLITYTNAQGQKVSALPFETEEAYYLIKMTKLEAQRIIEEDDDYDDEGVLRDDFADEIEAGDEDDDSSYDEPVDDSGDDEDDID
ncbi:MAG: hypothetical protein Kow0075_03760 [Salibacteraceae bacterium]